MILMQIQMTLYLVIALILMAGVAIGLFLRGIQSKRIKVIWSGVILILVWLVTFDVMYIWYIWR